MNKFITLFYTLIHTKCILRFQVFLFLGFTLFSPANLMAVDKYKSFKRLFSTKPYPRNIDPYTHFISMRGYKSNFGLEYHYLFSRNFLVGFELDFARGYKKTNIPGRIPEDFYHSSSSYNYYYLYNERLRIPYVSEQSFEDRSKLRLSLKYLLLNTPFYLGIKLSNELKGGVYKSREYLYSDLGVSLLCDSSLPSSSCATSSGSVDRSSFGFELEKKSRLDLLFGFGFLWISKFGIFIQADIYYQVNNPKYKLFAFNDYALNAISGLNSPSFLELKINEKILESRIKEPSRFEPQIWLGYAFSMETNKEEKPGEPE